MNAIHPFTALQAFTPATYEKDSYVMTEADFLDEPEVRTIDGRTYGTGRTVLGDMRTVRLNVPLCVGCDVPISDHICVRCELDFRPQETGPNRYRAEAA